MDCCALERHWEVGLKKDGSEERTVGTQEGIQIGSLSHRILPYCTKPGQRTCNSFRKQLAVPIHYHINKSILPDVI